MEFTPEQWAGLKTHCDEAGIVLPELAVLARGGRAGSRRLDAPAWKIASGEINNHALLRACGETGLPILLSSGMSPYRELDEAVAVVGRSKSPLAILQCTTQYPCPPEQIGLNVLSELDRRYACPIGLSDHSGEIYPGLAAVALGANLVEVHATFSKEMFGPDVPASLTLEQLATLIQGVRFIETMLDSPVDKDAKAAELEPLRKLFNKSVVLRRELTAGTVLTREHLAMKKPGTGIPARGDRSRDRKEAAARAPGRSPALRRRSRRRLTIRARPRILEPGRIFRPRSGRCARRRARPLRARSARARARGARSGREARRSSAPWKRWRWNAGLLRCPGIRALMYCLTKLRCARVEPAAQVVAERRARQPARERPRSLPARPSGIREASGPSSADQVLRQRTAGSGAQARSRARRSAPSPPSRRARRRSWLSWPSPFGRSKSYVTAFTGRKVMTGVSSTAASTAVMHPLWMSAWLAISQETTFPSCTTRTFGSERAASIQGSRFSTGCGRTTNVCSGCASAEDRKNGP